MVVKDRIGIQIVASRPDYLASLLTSLRYQTATNWDLFILVQDKNVISPLVSTLLKRIEYEGHRVCLIHSTGVGIGKLRNDILEQCDTEIGIRIDDDSICEPNYLDILYTILRQKTEDGVQVGVVGGIVPYANDEKTFLPLNFMEENVRINQHMDVPYMTTHFYNVFDFHNIEADHITSSYMYYNKTINRVRFPTFNDDIAGFREETFPLVQLKAMGYKHFFCPAAVCWHMAAPTGGTRDAWNKVGTHGRAVAEERYKDRVKEFLKGMKNVTNC
jgi:hypothetical protein